MEQSSVIFCECEYLIIFFWTLPKAGRRTKIPSGKRCFGIVLTENKLCALLYTPQTKRLGVGKFCFHSVKMFYLNLSCIFHHSMESFNMNITQKEKKCFWTNSVEYFDRTFFIFLSWFWYAFSTIVTKFCEAFSFQRCIFLM